ncbi:hypothetical protein SAMN05216436_12080 [bacterium A37T11]|nr:hypothetical protein SAMN05216436_12080 [bacterium A37T11]
MARTCKQAERRILLSLIDSPQQGASLPCELGTGIDRQLWTTGAASRQAMCADLRKSCTMNRIRMFFNMKKLFQKFDKVTLSIVFFACLTAAVVKAAERMQTTQWYNVTIIDEDEDHDDSNNQAIGSALPGGPTGSCVDPSGAICAIQLNVPTGNSVPATVADARSSSTYQYA